MERNDFRCSVCGAGFLEDGALLGSVTRWVGGRGYAPVVQCRDERRCWERRDVREALAVLDRPPGAA